MAHDPSRRRSKMMGRRRRADDEADDRPDLNDTEDESGTDDSAASDDNDIDALDSANSSNVDAVSPDTPTTRKPEVVPDIPIACAAKSADTAGMLQQLSVDGPEHIAANIHDNGSTNADISTPRPLAGINHKAPLVVSSDMRHAASPSGDRRPRDEDDQSRPREQDPASVPTRGQFFMHDYRHAAKTFRGQEKSNGRTNGRGGMAGPFVPLLGMNDPTMSGPWAHDLHDAVTEPPSRYHRHGLPARRPSHSTTGSLPLPRKPAIARSPNSATPINRDMSSERPLGKVTVRVWLPAVGMKEPVTVPGLVVTQRIKLPQHRPPLRRDKPVRISLPGSPSRAIFPAEDRSFIFIPREPRASHAGNKSHSRLGSIGGWSRRTSIFDGSVYSPSRAVSRRSSIVHDSRDPFPPAGSMSFRPPMTLGVDTRPVPVVRLPPAFSLDHASDQARAIAALPRRPSGPSSSISDYPHPHFPLPIRPSSQGSIMQNTSPPQQPLPQKPPMSCPTTESRDGQDQADSHAYPQAFHQQVPISVSTSVTGYPPSNSHTRRSSYAASAHGYSTGTPLSQIPERAIHAAPFQPGPGPAAYGRAYYNVPYGMMHPPHHMYSPGNYYTHAHGPPGPSPNGPGPYGNGMPHSHGPSATAPQFVPGGKPQDQQYSQPSDMQPAGSGHIQHEHNGMVYYFDASQIHNMQSHQMHAYPPPPPPPPYGPYPYGAMPMPVGPAPDGYYYPPHGAPHGPPRGTMYYGQ